MTLFILNGSVVSNVVCCICYSWPFRNYSHHYYFPFISMPASCSLLDQRSQKLQWISVIVLFSHQKMCRQVGNKCNVSYSCIMTPCFFSHIFTLVSFWTQALRTLFNVAHRLHNVLGPSWVLVSNVVPFFLKKNWVSWIIARSLILGVVGIGDSFSAW